MKLLILKWTVARESDCGLLVELTVWSIGLRQKLYGRPTTEENYKRMKLRYWKLHEEMRNSVVSIGREKSCRDNLRKDY